MSSSYKVEEANLRNIIHQNVTTTYETSYLLEKQKGSQLIHKEQSSQVVLSEKKKTSLVFLIKNKTFGEKKTRTLKKKVFYCFFYFLQLLFISNLPLSFIFRYILLLCQHILMFYALLPVYCSKCTSFYTFSHLPLHGGMVFISYFYFILFLKVAAWHSQCTVKCSSQDCRAYLKRQHNDFAIF